MKTYIALLRGINVGGLNALPMKELVALLVDLGCRDVKSYIQSGKVVFRTSKKGASELAGEISVAVGKRRGLKPHVFVLQLLIRIDRRSRSVIITDFRVTVL